MDWAVLEMGDLAMGDDELETTSEDDDEIVNVEPERVRNISVSMEARRKLEDRLEKRRLEQLIRDYDFDLD